MIWPKSEATPVLISSGEDQLEFREAVLSEWLGEVMEEKLDKEMPMGKPAKEEVPQAKGRSNLLDDETHL